MGNVKITAALVLLTVYTLLCGAEDLKRRTISLKWSLAFAAAGTIICVTGHRDLAALLKALVPGAGVLGLSMLTNGAVGRGDAMYLAVCALFADVELIVRMVVTSMILCAVAAMIMIVKGYTVCREMKKESLPYLTFMIPALIISLAVAVRV